MTQNVMQLWPQITSIVIIVVVLFVFALAIAMPNHSRVPPGMTGDRKSDNRTDLEEIRPDGYIDDFAKDIEEAGGSLPIVVKIAIPTVLLIWLLYLIINWVPR